MFASRLNSSCVTWLDDPLPGEATRTPPGARRAVAMKSATLRSGRSAFMMSRFGIAARSAMCVKSRIAS